MKYLKVFLIFWLVVRFSFSQTFFTSELVKHTSIKDQHYSGTCWIFGTLSFLESEILRLYDVELDLSEQYINYYAFLIKAKQKVSNPQNFIFTEGGFTQLVFDIWKKYGIVLDDDYPMDLTDHSDLNDKTENFLDSIITAKPLPKNWFYDYKKIVQHFLHIPPNQTHYNNNIYTPRQFADLWKLNFDDYVFLTSFERQPFYEFIPIEFNEPYDWTHQKYFNVPIDTLISIMETALKKGYSLVVDLSLSSYFYSSKGYADVKLKEGVDFQQVREKVLNPNHQVMKYDHIMHIVGLSADVKGRKYFYTKNSWGVDSGLSGYMYISYDYFKVFGIYVVVHKDGLSRDILRKIQIAKNKN